MVVNYILPILVRIFRFWGRGFIPESLPASTPLIPSALCVVLWYAIRFVNGCNGFFLFSLLFSLLLSFFFHASLRLLTLTYVWSACCFPPTSLSTDDISNLFIPPCVGFVINIMTFSRLHYTIPEILCCYQRITRRAPKDTQTRRTFRRGNRKSASFSLLLICLLLF